MSDNIITNISKLSSSVINDVLSNPNCVAVPTPDEQTIMTFRHVLFTSTILAYLKMS